MLRSRRWSLPFRCQRLTVGSGGATRETFTYKTVGDCAIKADVFNASPREKYRSLAVWIHGGALIMGDRRGIDKTLLDALINAGYVVVSIDYRLAPETKLPGILDDVRAAFAWVRAEGPRSWGTRNDRIAVLGGSAGGYLTLVTRPGYSWSTLAPGRWCRSGVMATSPAPGTMPARPVLPPPTACVGGPRPARQWERRRLAEPPPKNERGPVLPLLPA